MFGKQCGKFCRLRSWNDLITESHIHLKPNRHRSKHDSHNNPHAIINRFLTYLGDRYAFLVKQEAIIFNFCLTNLSEHLPQILPIRTTETQKIKIHCCSFIIELPRYIQHGPFEDKTFAMFTFSQAYKKSFNRISSGQFLKVSPCRSGQIQQSSPH